MVVAPRMEKTPLVLIMADGSLPRTCRLTPKETSRTAASAARQRPVLEVVSATTSPSDTEGSLREPGGLTRWKVHCYKV